MRKSLDPYQEYENNAVSIAEPKKLILMLYSGAEKFLKEALRFIEDYKSYDKANENILKAQDIITELMLALDMEKGGEIAKNLFSLYAYMKKELLTANMNKDPKPIHGVLKHLGELKEGWANMDTNNSKKDDPPRTSGDRDNLAVSG